jgi:hypothetical protein
MQDPGPQDSPWTPTRSERRSGEERRQRHWYGLLQGHSFRRRHDPRRAAERHLAVVDWHRSHWLAVGLLILVLSILDAFATLTLISRGATEINPVMAPLVKGSGHGFAFWKLGLTIFGVVVLTALSRIRIHGRLRVGALLYVVLGIYVVLVAYESWLLWGPHGAASI